jgi:hypothetical protein
MELHFQYKTEVDKAKLWSENIDSAIHCATNNLTMLDKVKIENEIDPGHMQNQMKFNNGQMIVRFFY